MTSFTETRIWCQPARPGVDPLKPWPDRIREAEERGKFSEDDRVMASNWVTCACGQQDERIPRQRAYGFMPVDDQLRALGEEFFDAVAQNRFITAQWVLERIEFRAAVILKSTPEPLSGENAHE